MVKSFSRVDKAVYSYRRQEFLQKIVRRDNMPDELIDRKIQELVLRYAIDFSS
jgi:hypothetical protein